MSDRVSLGGVVLSGGTNVYRGGQGILLYVVVDSGTVIDDDPKHILYTTYYSTREIKNSILFVGRMLLFQSNYNCIHIRAFWLFKVVLHVVADSLEIMVRFHCNCLQITSQGSR